jgi:hypothetical protein
VPLTDAAKILSLLRDPNVGSQEIADATGLPREDAARAARIASGLARAQPGEVLGLPPTLAAAIIRAAVEAGRVDLLTAALAHPARDVVKEAKRGVHLLRTRGVKVEEPARPALPKPAAPAEPELPCHASAIDGRGERAIWISRSVPGRGIEVGQTVVSDEIGIVDLQMGMLGRKEHRQFIRNLAERGAPMAVVEVDRDRARAWLAAARRRNDESGQAAPAGADAWLSRLGPAGEPPEPGSRVPPLDPAAESAALAASGELHDLPLLRGWLPDEESLRTLAGKLDEIAASPLYLDEAQRAAQMRRTIAEATEAHFADAGQRRLLGRRLLAVADHLADAGDGESAGRAAAAGRAILAGSAPDAIPFARMLFEKAFSVEEGAVGPEEAAPAKRPDEPSLIIAPR